MKNPPGGKVAQLLDASWKQYHSKIWYRFLFSDMLGFVLYFQGHGQEYGDETRLSTPVDYSSTMEELGMFL